MKAGLLQSPQSDLLKRVADKVEKTVKPEDRQTYDAIVVSGMKLMWGNPKTHQQMVEYLQEAKQNPASLPQAVAHGLMWAMAIILKESKIPLEQFIGPSAPASIVLMTQALDYVQKKLGVPVNQAVVDQCTKAITQGLFELYDVPPEQIDQAIAAGRKKDESLPAGGPTTQPIKRAPGGM